METEELIKKYNIDVEKLKEEQFKLAKQLEIKDKIDFSLADKFGAINNRFVNGKILCSVILCDGDFEILDKSYGFEKTRFPYIPGFRSYRELPAMVLAFEKLKEKPDVVFILGQGIVHPILGLASHFSLSVGVPVVGISDSVIDCEIKGEDILKDGRKVGKVLISKEGSRPMYISPGNGISIESAFSLVKKFVRLPHKLPEPLHLAGKYSRDVKKEVGV
jgi:deoxyribonuclease V